MLYNNCYTIKKEYKMANHIRLTAKDGSMTIIDKNRIISCEKFYPVDQEKYDSAKKEYARQYNLWSDQKIEAFDLWSDQKSEDFFASISKQGEWEVNNPSPERPAQDDYRINESFTLIKLNNKTSIMVKETAEEIFSKLKDK